MKVSAIPSFSFKAKIIDAHTHVGSHNNRIYTKQNLDLFIKSELPSNDVVEKMLVTSLDVIHQSVPEYEGNIKLLEEFNNDPHYNIFAACSPVNGSVENIKRLYKDHPNKFIGLKFHPSVQNLPADNVRYNEYLNFANKNKIPCLFHCEVNLDKCGNRISDLLNNSDPERIYTIAKRYKDTPIVMAHLGAGWRDSHEKTLEILLKSIECNDANLYADISWVDIDHEKTHIVSAIKKLKGIGDPNWKYGDQSYRLMFGTDAPIDRFSQSDAINSYSKYIEEIKTAIKNDTELKNEAETIIDDLFFNNAKRLYLNKKHPPKTTYNKKFGVLVIVGGIVLSSLVLLTKNCLLKKILPECF